MKIFLLVVVLALGDQGAPVVYKVRLAMPCLPGTTRLFDADGDFIKVGLECYLDRGRPMWRIAPKKMGATHEKE